MTGVGVYSARLLEAMLAEEGERQWALTHLPGAPVEPYADRHGARLVETQADYGDHPVGEIWLNAGLRALLKHERADLFHGPAYLVPWLPTRAKKIVTIHDLVAFRQPGAYTRRFAWYMRQITRLSARAADGIVAVSESTANDLVELLGVKREKIRVIHEAADPRLVEPGADQVAEVRSRHGIEGQYLLYVGTIEPRKGICHAVGVLERLRGKGVDVSLVLAGSVGWRADAILAAIDASPARDSILRLGYVDDDDLPGLYGGAAALLYLTDYEGFGLPPLEAMACGCPVVATRRASLPEVVGDAGLLVEPDEEETVANAVADWIASPERRASMVENGLQQAARFSWQRAAKETLEYYDEILGSR